jgi:Tfp pilus assembly protein PilN
MKQLLSQWLPQSGIGIEFRAGSLRASYCKRSWKGFYEIDRLEIAGYEEAGALECGRLYRAFLRKHGLKAPWTVVALPRAHVLLRALKFPTAIANDLAPAIELQLDSLHPFADGAVVWDEMLWNLSGSAQAKSANGAAGPDSREVRALVAIAPRQYVEGLTDWFRAAGIPVSQFTVSTALLLAYLRGEIAARAQARERYFLLHESEQGFDLIGCAPDGGIISREIALLGARSEDEVLELLRTEIDRAGSELRLEPVDQPRIRHCGAGVLPASLWQSGGLPFEVVSIERTPAHPEDVLSVAAGYAATSQTSFPTLNLLPPALRSFEAPLVTMPTYALASVVVLLALATALQGNVQDWRYSRYLEREKQALQPRIQEIEKLKQTNQEAVAHLGELATYRRSGALPLDLLDELTRTLPPDAWLQQLQYDGSTVAISGTAMSASAVLQALTASKYLEGAQFSAALNRTAEGKEIFRIGARLRGANPRGANP